MKLIKDPTSIQHSWKAPKEPQHKVLLINHTVMTSSRADLVFNWSHVHRHKQMTFLEDLCLCSFCVWWLCCVKQEEWPLRDTREEKKREASGACSLLVLPFPFVTLEVLPLCLLAFFKIFLKKIKFKSLNYFYRNTTRDLGTAPGLNCGENGGGGGWMGLIMSLEGGGMCSLCFGHLLHSTSPCFI